MARNIVPRTDKGSDLGTPTKRWNTVYTDKLEATIVNGGNLGAVEQSAGDEVTLRSLIATAGSNPTSITIYNDIPITTTDLTIPSNIHLRFKEDGKLSPASGITLTVNGSWDAGLWQIFGLEGTITGDPSVPCLYPQWFGAVINDDTAGINNYLAIRRTLAMALSPSGAGVLEGQKRIHFTAGKWFIQGNSPFCFNRTEMTSLPGNYRYRRGLKISGDGRNSSILILKNAGEHTWFYSTYDPAYPDSMSVMDFVEFESLTFRGHETWDVDRKYQVPDTDKISGFYMESHGWEKYFIFTKCQFSGLDTAFHYAGYGSVDHNTFIGCSFSGIRDYVFYINNTESVANKLLGCDIEGIYGDVFHIGRHGGGDLMVKGGSIVLQPRYGDNNLPDLTSTERRAFLHIDLEDQDPTSETLGQAANLFSFENLRFEIYDDLQKLVLVKRDSGTIGGSADISFTGCSFHTEYNRDADDNSILPPDTLREAVIVENDISVKITFRNCHLNKRHQYVIRNYTYSGRGSDITFESCYCGWNPFNNVTLGGNLASRCIRDNVTTGYFSARNTTYGSLRADNSNYQVAGDFDIGANSPFASHSLTVKAAHLISSTQKWIYMGGIVKYLLLPPGATIFGVIGYKPPIDVPPETPETVSYAIMDSSNNILWQSDSISEEQSFIVNERLNAPFTVPAEPDNYVKLVAIGNGKAEQPFGGYLVVEYL